MQGPQLYWDVWDLLVPILQWMTQENPSGSCHCVALIIEHKPEAESTSSHGTPICVQSSVPYIVGDSMQDVTLLISRDVLDCSFGLCGWHIVCDVTFLLKKPKLLLTFYIKPNCLYSIKQPSSYLSRLVFDDLAHNDNLGKLDWSPLKHCPSASVHLILCYWNSSKLAFSMMPSEGLSDMQVLPWTLAPTQCTVVQMLTLQWIIVICIFLLSPLFDYTLFEDKDCPSFISPAKWSCKQEGLKNTCETKCKDRNIKKKKFKVKSWERRKGEIQLRILERDIIGGRGFSGGVTYSKLLFQFL